MTISIGSRLVHRAKLFIPWCGRPVVRAWFVGAPLSGKVTVQWGNTQIVGTVIPEKSGEVVGESVATIVCGIGWQNEPPSLWLIDNSASPAKVVQQLAQAIGEMITVAANALRPGRITFARADQQASITLESTLADEAIWWVNLDGTTGAALDRPAPVFDPARVLEFDAEARTATLDIEEPANLVGATIAASGERVPVASRIYEVSIEADENGIRTTARLEKPSSKAPYLSDQLEAITRNPKPYPHATWRGATVESQERDRRVSLRLEARDKELADPLPVSVWCGVPGVSAEVFSGTRIMLAFDRADPTNPFAALWSPYGQAGHVPDVVYHEANDEIQFFSESAGKGKFGITTQPVAKATNLVAYLEALEEWALQTDIFIAALAAAVPFPLPTPPAPYPDAIAARVAAAANIGSIPAIKLEAQ